MDNSVIPYEIPQSPNESDDSEDSSESSSDNGMLLSDNIGMYNRPNENINQKYFLNMEQTHDYIDKRNKLFTPEISKHRIVVESKSLNHTGDHDTSNYVVNFNDQHNSNHNGYSVYDNVIGFKFIKSFIPHSIYQVNDNNNIIQLETAATQTSITLNNGTYNFTELKNHLLTKLSGVDNNFTVTADINTYKYTITHTVGVKFLWLSSPGYSWRIFGFPNTDDVGFKGTHTSENMVQHNNHFVDLVIPEIPYIACKHNNTRKNIIERIPLASPGEIKEYVDNYNLDNYFFPIKLSKITIQLYEDSTDMFYQCQNADNAFEFEVTILNKLS